MVKKVISKYTHRLDIHTFQVIRTSSASLLVKIFGAASAIALSIILGRNLGVDKYGTYELAIRISAITLIFSLVGMPNVILKEVAIGFSRSKWQYIKDHLFTAGLIASISSIILSVSLILLAPFLSQKIFQSDELINPFRIILSALLFQSLTRILAAGINGLGKIWQSNLINETLGVLLFLSGIFIILVTKQEFDLDIIARLFLLSRIIVTISGFIYWHKIFSYQTEKGKFQYTIIKPSLLLFLASSSSIIVSNANAVILGAFSNTVDVGLFSTATKIVFLTVFFLQITNSAVSPKIASLYANNDIASLKKMLFNVTRLLWVIGILCLFGLIAFGKWILNLWGEDFQEAYRILVILSIGQFVNISTGAVGVLLIMSGNEKSISRISLSFMIINVLLNLVFIYFWGILGAAIATALSIIGENLTRLIVAYNKTGILTIKRN